MIGNTKKFLIDTNIIIDQLRGFKTITELFDGHGENENFTTYISVISELEIYSGKSMDRIRSKKIADKLLDKIVKIPVNSRVARYAGKLKRKFSINFPDSLIASTAILNKCTLVTRNVKHFQNIPKLKITKS